MSGSESGLGSLGKVGSGGVGGKAPRVPLRPTPSAAPPPEEVPLVSTYIERVDKECVVIRGLFGGRGSEEDRRQAHLRCQRLESVSSSSRISGLALPSNRDKGPDRAPPSLPRYIAYWAGRAFCILCCPPLPSSIVHKVVFQPPRKPTYAFVAPDGTRLTRRNAHIFAQSQSVFRVQYTLDYMETIFNPINLSELRGFLVPMKETTTGSGHLAAVHLPQEPDREPGPFLFLYSHANAVDIGGAIPTLFKLRRRLGCPVVAYDYTGYGLSSGKCNESDFYASALAVLSHLVHTLRLAPASRIIAWGFSLGTAATVYLAGPQGFPDLAAVVLAGAFISAVNAVRRVPRDTDYACRKSDKLRSYALIAEIKAPVLFCHGLEDRVTRVQHAVWLLERCQRPLPPLFLPDTGHNDLCEKPRLWSRLRELLHHDLGGRQPHAKLRLLFAQALQAACRWHLHAACLGGRSPCRSCHHRLLRRFFTADRLAFVELDTDFAERATLLSWEVQPHVTTDATRSWQGRFALILSSPLHNASDVRLAIAAQGRPLPDPPSDPPS